MSRKSLYDELLVNKKKEERIERIGAFIGEIILLFIEALLLMLFLGLAHGVESVIPNWGYWDSFFMILLTNSVVSIVVRAAAKSWKSV